MKISNAKVFIDGAFVRGGAEFDGIISAAGPEVTGGIDAEGGYLLPGLVDIHSHGALGEDASDADPEGLIRLSRCYAAEGAEKAGVEVGRQQRDL